MMTAMIDSRPTWDSVWLTVAETVSKRSRCSRAQMGAAIVSHDQHIVATGYNGPAANWPENGACIDWCDRAKGVAALDNIYDACPAIHAEANALMYVDRSRSQGGTIYITAPPCMQCAKLISNSGIARVVCYWRKQDSHRDPATVLEYLEKCMIKLTVIKEQDVN